MKKIIAIALSVLTLVLASCGDRQEDISALSDGASSAAVSEEEQMSSDLTKNAHYFYSYDGARYITGDSGDELTDGDSEPVSFIINDVNKTFGDWYGATHTTTLYEGKDPYFCIECDIGFPASPEKAEIVFDPGAYMPEKVELYRSDDGYNYSFYLGEMTGGDGTFTYVFDGETTVKSLKFVIYAPIGKKAGIISLAVTGKSSAERILLSEGAAYTVGGSTPESLTVFADDGKRLTDGAEGGFALRDKGYSALQSTEKDALMNRPVIPVTVDLGSVKNVSEVYLGFASQKSGTLSAPDFISVEYSENGTDYIDFSMSFERGSLIKTGITRSVYAAMRSFTVKARYLRINIFSSSCVALDEISVYGAESEVSEPEYEFPEFSSYKESPVIRGGFYGFFIDYIEGYNPHHYFDEHRIYIQLKGFRELGMDTIIVGGENMSYETKKTLCETPEALAAEGYTKGTGHGVYDLNEAILSAADKLGMKVYVSTLSSLAYASLPAVNDAKNEYIDAVLKDAAVIIPYIYEKYSSHESLVGFYLTDESCDQWLAQEKGAGTAFTRKLYKGESDIIRSLDEKMLVAIAPAAWRSDTPENFGNNLCSLIKSDTEGGRPIVDIVFVQDCLGREATIAVPDTVYSRYADYLAECRRGVEAAGAVFGNDTEIFDVGYRIKRFDEIIRSLELETPYSDENIVYDLSHYFSQQGRGSVNGYAYFDNDYVCLQYAKYIAKLTK